MSGPFASGPFSGTAFPPAGVRPFVGGPFAASPPFVQPSLFLSLAAAGAPISGQDGRASAWWNLMRGGVNEPDFLFGPDGTLAFGPHNGIAWSEDFGNASWAKSLATVTQNATTAPDGTLTADKLVSGVGSGYPVASSVVNVVAGLRYTITVFARAAEWNFLSLQVGGVSWSSQGQNSGVRFNLTTGAIAGAYNGQSSANAQITDEGGGWYRCSVSWDCAASTPSGTVAVIWGNLNSTSPVTGDGTSGIFAWGAQFNAGGRIAYLRTLASAIWSTIPRITYSGASIATMFGSDGLLQRKPHNFMLWSQDFSNATWTKTRATVPISSTVRAPDGVSAAFKLTEDNSAATTHFIVQAFGQDRSLRRAITIFAQPAERGIICIQDNAFSSNFIRCFFDLNARTVTTTQSGNGSVFDARIILERNGWLRCVLIGTPNTTSGGTSEITYFLATNTADLNYTGDGTSGLHIWGSGVTLGGLQPYYPTGAAAFFGPRFVYDPLTLVARGLLPEEARTNVALWSRSLANAAWSKTRASITLNAGIGIDGTLYEALIEDTSASNTHAIAQSIALALATTYTYSAVVKPFGRSAVRLRVTSSTDSFIGDFNLTGNGSVLGTSVVGTGTVTGSGVSLLPNGWYLIHLTGQMAAGLAPQIDLFLRNVASTAFPSYTGDGVSGVLLGDLQVEVGSLPSSRILTLGASATRAADLPVMSGLSFSSWYNATEGAFFASWFAGGAITESRTALHADDGTTSNRMMLIRNTSGVPAFTVTVGGVTQADITAGGAVNNAPLKVAANYNLNAFAVSANASAVGTDASGTVPTVSQLCIGHRPGPANHLNSPIDTIAYFPLTLPDGRLRSLGL